MSTSTNQKSELQNYYLEQALVELKERVEDQHVFADFDEFSNLEQIIDGCLQLVTYTHIQQYERLCELYIRKVIKGIQLTSKSTTRRYTEKGSYFHDQSLKIKDTDHYQFLTELLENNFLDLAGKLYLDVKDNQFSAEELEKRNKYQYLVKNDNLIKKQCIGCNHKFLQFSLIKEDSLQYGYELQFLQHVQCDQTQEDKEHKIASKVFNFNNPDNQARLLHKIIRILNKNGGFICFGCKEIQEFKGIKEVYSCYQLRKRFMEGYIVTGYSLSQEKQEEIRQFIASICKKITPKVEIGHNIAVSFRSIMPSPYTLGFNFQEIQQQESLFYSKGYNIILIKVHPTAQGEYYQDKGSQKIFQQDQDYLYDGIHDNDDQAGRQESVAENFFNLISMSKEDLERQKCGKKKNKRSYFDSHDCI